MSIPLNVINQIQKEINKPFYLYDLRQIINNYEEFDRIFNENFLFSNFFAVKALPNPHILKELYDAGFECFDASSIEELELLKFAGIPLNKENVFFTSNYSSREQLKKAAELGVIMNFDSYEQFETFLETGIKLKSLCFRLNPNLESSSVEKSNCFSGSQTKFGIDEDEYVEKYMEAINILQKSMKEDDFENIKIGIHIMPGSNILKEEHWKKLVDKVLEIMKKINYQIDFINFGGGIGIPYKPEDKKVNLELIEGYINNGINEYYNDIGENNNIKIYMENGRFITGPYGWFVTNLQSIKLKDSGDLFYGLNASMADLMRPGMYNAYHSIKIFRGHRQLEPDEDYDVVNVVGTLCENNDWFAKERNLSIDAQIGDTFVIENCGAHCRAMGFNYNSKLRPQEWAIDLNGKINKIRREETFDDLISTIEPINKNSSKYDIISISLILAYLFILIYIHN
jgi:diaminopimelate decarboxylase